MHIIYVVTKLELGGAQKVCLALFRGMHGNASLISGSEGVLVPLVARNKSAFLLKTFTRDVGLKTLGNEIFSFFQMWRLMRLAKKKYRHVIVHTHSTKAGLMGRWAAFFARIPCRIHTIHGFGFNEYQKPLVRKLQFLCEWVTSLITTHYVCVSRLDYCTGRQLFPRFAKKSSLIHAAVDHIFFNRPTRAHARDTEVITFGTISCFKPQKNLIDLLEVFLLVHQHMAGEGKQVHLNIIGDGHLRSTFESWIDEHKMRPFITLLGWQDKVAQHLSTWNVFVMSSLWEGLPCSVVEARLCKLPVVAYDAGGISEVILNDKNGFVIPRGNIQLLAEKMILLASDDTLRKRLASYADHATLASFNQSHMIDLHKSLYEKLC